jgi:site-specific DNA recombinase
VEPEHDSRPREPRDRILNNELYIGRLVWNRQRFLKDPDTGKRVARPNFSSEWITTDVPELRIVDADLWDAVKARQAVTRHTVKTGIVRARRPKYLFSGLTKCESCGGGFILSSREDLRCFNNTARGTCTNSRTIKRQDLETRVLRAMRERFFEQGAFEAFCEGFTEELNRLRREHRTQLASAPREISGIKRRSQQILKLLLEGFRNEEWKDELRRLDERRLELEAAVAAGATDPPKPALHPQMAKVFRQKATTLAAALERDGQRDAARLALRDFIERIVIPPGEGLLQVVGNLGEMLTAASGRNGSGAAAVGYVGCGGRI